MSTVPAHQEAFLSNKSRILGISLMPGVMHGYGFVKNETNNNNYQHCWNLKIPLAATYTNVGARPASLLRPQRGKCDAKKTKKHTVVQVVCFREADVKTVCSSTGASGCQFSML